MQQKAQAGLEYLLTYGWGLIVISIIIGALIFVTGWGMAGATCQINSSALILNRCSVGLGDDAVSVELRNATGTHIKVYEPNVGSGFGSGVGDDPQLIIDGEEKQFGVDMVPPGSTFVINNLDGPSEGGTLADATITINYTTAAGLPAAATITATGSVAVPTNGGAPTPSAELCEVTGDEDLDGLADCLDTEDCPHNTFCDAGHIKRCWYENCLDLSSCPLNQGCIADLDFDGDVDDDDYAILQQYMLQECNADNLWCEGADLDCSGAVIILDYSIMATNYGPCP